MPCRASGSGGESMRYATGKVVRTSSSAQSCLHGAIRDVLEAPCLEEDEVLFHVVQRKVQCSPGRNGDWGRRKRLLTSNDCAGESVTTIEADSVTTSGPIYFNLSSIWLESFGRVFCSDATLNSKTSGGDAILGQPELS